MNNVQANPAVSGPFSEHDVSGVEAERHEAPAPGLWPPVVVFSFTAALLSPLLLFPFARDHGVYAVVAEAMSEGLMPYRDAWDIKTPGIFYLFRLSLGLFGRGMWGIRVLELTVQSLTVSALYLLGCRLLKDRIAAFCGAFYAVLLQFHALNWWHTAQAESFLSLPFVLSLLLLLGIRSQTRTSGALLRLGFSGLFLGAVFVFKFPNILPFACIVPLIPALKNSLRIISGSTQAQLTAVGLFCIGFMLIPMTVALHFFSAGAWHSLWETLFVFAPRYAGITFSGGLLTHGFHVLVGFFFSGGMTVIKLLCLMGLLLVFSRLKESGRLVLLLWFLAAYSVIWIQAKFFLYHFLPLYLPCALLAGLTSCSIARATASRFKIDPASQPRVRIVLATMLIVLPAVVEGVFISRQFSTAARVVSGSIPRDTYFSQFRDGTDFSLSADIEVATHLGSMTNPDETIFIWGFEPLVYYLSERRPASRFITHQPVASRWQMAGWRDELMSDLERRRPSYFLVLRNDSMPAVTGFGQDSLELLRGFPALGDLLERQYVLECEIEDFMIYRRNVPGGADS